MAGNLGVSMYNIGICLCEVCLHLRLFVKGWAFGLSTWLELVLGFMLGILHKVLFDRMRYYCHWDREFQILVGIK